MQCKYKSNMISKKILITNIIVIIGVAILLFAVFTLKKESVLDVEQNITNIVKKAMDKGKIPGVSVHVVNNKISYQKNFGYANIEKRQKVTENTLFELGSNSKAFTATGIYLLEEQGLLNLESQVDKYISWFSANYKGEKVKIKVKDFLYHTSGIPFRTIEDIPVSNSNNALEETVKTLRGVELESMPGSKYNYATINYDVLGLIIEKVTGMTFEEYIRKNVLEELELNNTYFISDTISSDQLAQGYILSFGNSEPCEQPIYRGNIPAGYFLSSVKDMKCWLDIQINGCENKMLERAIKKTHIPNRSIVAQLSRQKSKIFIMN